MAGRRAALVAAREFLPRLRMQLTAYDPLVPVVRVPRLLLLAGSVQRLDEEHVTILEIWIDLGQSAQRWDNFAGAALVERSTGMGDRRAPEYAPQLVLLDIEPIVEVGGRGDPQAGAEVAAIKREDGGSVLEFVAQHPLGPKVEVSDVRLRRQRDRAAIGFYSQGQSGAQLAQMPAQALTRIGGVRKEQVREHVAVLWADDQREPDQQRKHFRAELEWSEESIGEHGCWPEEAEH